MITDVIRESWLYLALVIPLLVVTPSGAVVAVFIGLHFSSHPEFDPEIFMVGADVVLLSFYLVRVMATGYGSKEN
jgi:hypothetical protein